MKFLNMHNPGLDSKVLEQQLQAITNITRYHYIPLPNLRRLSITFDITLATAKILGDTLFRSPHLQEFWMATCESPLIGLILSSLAVRHPEIPVIEVYSWPALPSGLISSFKNLRQFKTSTTLPPDEMYYLSGLDTLRKLRTNLPPTHRLDQIVCLSNAFSGLIELDLFLNQNVATLSSFLAAISSRTLERVQISFDEPEFLIAAYINDILETISKFTALRHLSLRGTHDGEVDVEGTFNIRPLLRLRELKVLDIRLGLLCSAFTDESIAEFGRAWPDLEALIYEQTVFPILPGTLTLNALPQCAHHLPRLVELVVDLDAAVAPEPLPSPVSDKPVEFDLTGSIVDHDNCAQVAAYIASVYPGAKIRVNSDAIASAETLYWTHLSSMLPLIAKMQVENRQLKAALDRDVEMSE